MFVTPMCLGLFVWVIKLCDCVSVCMRIQMSASVCMRVRVCPLKCMCLCAFSDAV